MTSRQTDPDLQSAKNGQSRAHVVSRIVARFIYVWVENSVDKADRGRLVRVLVGELDVDLPHAPVERRCGTPHVSIHLTTRATADYALSFGPSNLTNISCILSFTSVTSNPLIRLQANICVSRSDIKAALRTASSRPSRCDGADSTLWHHSLKRLLSLLVSAAFKKALNGQKHRFGCRPGSCLCRGVCGRAKQEQKVDVSQSIPLR